MIASRPVLMIALMSLGGCATQLPAVPNTRPVPAAWTQADVAPQATAEDRWWRAFGDPTLDSLVDRVELADDVAIAEARLAEALARLGSARARLRPEIGAAIDGESSQIDDLEQDQVLGLLSLAWSPDLNGARGERARAAEATLSAEAARVAAVRQATRATAVRLYIALREGQARAAAADRSVAALTDSLSLATSRERAGLTSGLDPVAARAQLAAARAEPDRAREAAETARLGLEALLGLSPGSLSESLARPGAVPVPAEARPLSAPLEVLARRPDLIAAERDLAAAGFDASAALRDFWPTISLAAAIGGQGIDPETPFSASGGLAQVSAGLAAPLFSFGRLEAARDAADARRTSAALNYRRAATLALSEVEQALVARGSAERRRRALADAVAAGRERVALAESRYRGGLTPFLDVLVAQTALAEAEQALAIADGDAARAEIGLATAMGLGAVV